MSYYNPPSPFIGGRQPLAPAQLTPPSGPAPSNPPQQSGIPAAVLVSWYAPSVVVVLPGPFVPIAPPPNPPPNPPPPFRLEAIISAWTPPDPWFQVARNRTPPSAAVASNPPIVGARIPAAVAVSWIPPPPMYQASHPKTPPSAAAPSNPPRLVRVMDIVLQAWAPMAPFRMPTFYSQGEYVPPTPGGTGLDMLLRWRRNGRR